MSRRKRKHIPLSERLAAAYLMLLPQDVRDDLRARRAPAREIIRMFTDDHGVLHALGGADRCWNLTPRLRGPALKAKDNRDTSIVAKVRRNDDKWREFMRTISKKRPGRRPAKKRGRKIASRPFQRRTENGHGRRL